MAGPIAAAAPPSLAAEPTVSFTHHDWTLACDNTRTCRAAGYQDYNDELAVSVLLTREAGPRAAVSGQLMLGQYEEAVGPVELSLHINGRDLGPVDGASGDGSVALSPAHVDALFQALAGDADIAFVADDGRRWRLSDKGATAVLLKMDEFQGRLHTPGALVRQGTRSEDDVLPSLPAPTIHLAAVAPTRPGDERLLSNPDLRNALQENLPDDEECRGLEPEEWDESAEIERLDDDTMLVSVRCWMGAYNVGRGFWVVDAVAPYRPRLVTTAAEYHEAGIIGASQKGRGLGDCWWQASWAWDGAAFVKASESTSGMCRLVAAGGAWTMPTLVSDLEQ
ncbi:DUF1176 domain-containing protein [Novilysobacter spongiicola]|uniref:DUF1176 domain-containing protein n=1 Tax=Lysobacter spongiicola DSM 21749 TaxID=1122188 RepID=A0A1T4SHX2_9GAMM|nr:DUF1176 domain-containing protein [Lysobacter spongiicola]SKA27431.1 Protein of unknown function [Lysobacter spongiicola DSM 21749]